MWSLIGQWFDANPISLLLIAVVFLVLIMRTVTSGQNELIENQGALIENQGEKQQALYKNIAEFVIGVHELKDVVEKQYLKNEENQSEIIKRLDKIEKIIEQCKEKIINGTTN